MEAPGARAEPLADVERTFPKTNLTGIPPSAAYRARADREDDNVSAPAIRVDTSDPDLSEHVAYLCRLFGQVLTAAIAGVEDARLVEAWSHGAPVERPDSRRRLQTAYDVARLLDESLSDQSVRGWFMGMNPDLHDRSPIEALSDDPERVLQAADDFLAHG